MGSTTVVLLFFVTVTSPDKAIRPNIVLILTDDQDATLGGAEPLEQGRKLLVDEGAEFTNAYATTPICCPSRASILTGRYLHNTGDILQASQYFDLLRPSISYCRGQEQLSGGWVQ